MPGVVVRTKFVYNWIIGGFLDYIARPRAFKGKLTPKTLEFFFADFMGYMGNEDKTDGLFSVDKNLLTDDDVNEIRKMEKASQDEGCPKYLGVISFDNDFLRDNGWIVGNTIDIAKIKSVARKSIAKLIDEEERFDKDNVYWTAAIHTNTDNVHIHFQLIEKHRLEDRRITYKNRGQDKIDVSSLEKVKSTVISEMLTVKRTPQLTELMRKVIIPEIGRNVSAASSINDLLNILPETNKAWQYNRKNIRPYQDTINKCVDQIISSSEELQNSFDEFKGILESMSLEYRKIYGNRKNPKISEYAENKMEDFYARAGNVLLKELFKIKNSPVLNLTSDIRVGKEVEINHMEKNAAVLLKKKYDAAKTTIADVDKSGANAEKRNAALDEMERLAQNNFYAAAAYLAYYYYKHRKESEKYDQKSEKYLKAAFENGDFKAAYLLGKVHLEHGSKSEAVRCLKAAADNGVENAQFLYGKIACECGSEKSGIKYMTSAELGGNEQARSYIQSHEKQLYKPRLGMRFSNAFRNTTINSQIVANRCTHAIKRLLNESNAHLKRLQNEYQYEQQRQMYDYIPYEREY